MNIKKIKLFSDVHVPYFTLIEADKLMKFFKNDFNL